MILQEGISVAIEFERKVRDAYLESARSIGDSVGRKTFRALAEEEARHVAYLERCLALWKKTGKVPDLPLASLIPEGVEWIEAAERKLQGRKGKRVPSKGELEALQEALRLERQSHAFYRKVVARLPRDDRPLFHKFLDIEGGHLALVKAQLRALRRQGFWLDVSAFIQDG